MVLIAVRVSSYQNWYPPCNSQDFASCSALDALYSSPVALAISFLAFANIISCSSNQCWSVVYCSNIALILYDPCWVVRAWDWKSQVMGSIPAQGLVLCTSGQLDEKAYDPQGLVDTIGRWKNGMLISSVHNHPILQDRVVGWVSSLCSVCCTHLK